MSDRETRERETRDAEEDWGDFDPETGCAVCEGFGEALSIEGQPEVCPACYGTGGAP